MITDADRYTPQPVFECETVVVGYSPVASGPDTLATTIPENLT